MNSPEYEAALEASRVASRIYTIAADKYSAREIDDAEFNVALSAFTLANAIFDEAFLAESNRPEEIAAVAESDQIEMGV